MEAGSLAVHWGAPRLVPAVSGRRAAGLPGLGTGEERGRVMAGARALAAGSDEQLAVASAAGDALAFQALAERYAKPAFNYAYHLLGGYDEANDAVQEALIQVYQALPKAKLDLPFRPWFYQILRNKCLDSLRRRKATVRLAPNVDDPDDAASPLEMLPDADPLPEEVYERQDLQQMLHACIGDLPPKYREVVALRYATELTFEEMGAALGLPVNTVKTHFQRAKVMLKRALLDRGGER